MNNTLETKINNIINQLPLDIYNTLFDSERIILNSYIKTKMDKRYKLNKDDKEYIQKFNKYDLNLFYCLLLAFKHIEYNQWTAIEFYNIKNEFNINEKDLDNILWELSHKNEYKVYWECTHGLNQIRFSEL